MKVVRTMECCDDEMRKESKKSWQKVSVWPEKLKKERWKEHTQEQNNGKKGRGRILKGLIPTPGLNPRFNTLRIQIEKYKLWLSRNQCNPVIGSSFVYRIWSIVQLKVPKPNS